MLLSDEMTLKPYLIYFPLLCLALLGIGALTESRVILYCGGVGLVLAVIIFAVLFAGSRSVEPITIESEMIGSFTIHSTSIMLAGNQEFDDATTIELPAGEYNVTLIIRRFEDGNQIERVSIASSNFGPHKVDEIKFDDEVTDNVLVDVGMLFICDSNAAKTKITRDQLAQLESVARKNRVSPLWFMIMDKESNSHGVAMRPPNGDGSYPVHVRRIDGNIIIECRFLDETDS